MDRSILWRAALVQTLAVGVLFAVLALSLPHKFFEDWGALVGPAGWIAASLVTWRALKLPLRTIAFASAVAGGAAALLCAVAEDGVALPGAIGGFAALCAVGRRGAPTAGGGQGVAWRVAIGVFAAFGAWGRGAPLRGGG